MYKFLISLALLMLTVLMVSITISLSGFILLLFAAFLPVLVLFLLLFGRKTIKITFKEKVDKKG